MRIEKLLEIAIAMHASDLHIFPGLVPLLRIDGERVPIKNQAVLSPEEAKGIIYEFMTEAQHQMFEQELTLDFAFSRPELGNFRVSTLHQLHGVGAVLRLLSRRVPTLDELGMPQIFKRFLKLPHGLILVTGPTGSGKSTTMAAMLEYINQTRSAHIITIEDPIEYIHASKKSAISQLQVGRDTTDFAAALRSSLRQDPDVVFVGEMRDLATINLGLIAAETGHLVVGTLHASSAPMAVSRIVDMFPPQEKNRVRSMLSETMQAVLCQTLVKKKTGGRIAAFEIMLATPAVRNLIFQDLVGQIEATMQTNGDIGMCTMEQYVQELVNKQLVASTVAQIGRAS